MTTAEILEWLDRPYFFAKKCNRLAPKEIRAVLAAPSEKPMHVFLKLAVDGALNDAQLAKAWLRAVAATHDLDTSYGWGSKQRKAKFAALAEDPVLLAAIQGTCANANTVKLDLLAVLVTDGSAASYDALVSHIAAASATKDTRLDLLRDLRTHAKKTPELDAMFAEIDGALEKRNAESPALALGPLIGIGEPSLLWFDVRLSSTRSIANGVPWIQGSVSVDSRKPVWFHAYASTVEPLGGESRSTWFRVDEETLRDQLDIGRCTAEQLPVWLAAAAKTIGIEWQAFAPSSNLRGKKRDRIAAWLRGD